MELYRRWGSRIPFYLSDDNTDTDVCVVQQEVQDHQPEVHLEVQHNGDEVEDNLLKEQQENRDVGESSEGHELEGSPKARRTERAEGK